MAIVKLTTPIAEDDIRKLHAGDILYISGTIFLARDEAHLRALEYAEEGKELPLDFKGLAVFHCGPIVKQDEKGEWHVVAAGPTTSSRMEIFQDKFIEKFRISAVIGKGGMFDRTTAAMQKYGAIYGAFTGGAAVLAAKAVKKVKGVEWLDLGTPEALWIFEVEEFGPLIVGIDSHGNNLFTQISKEVEKNRAKVYEIIGITQK
ncbi:MAG: fumarate hydratase C-terminal domain-containing protein [Candidatus Heimdallarchaeota archaeon]|nr:fumarate hydratase C-terminal domain-containing protein [Candidatus Heimdallarchaeota archaeon]